MHSSDRKNPGLDAIFGPISAGTSCSVSMRHRIADLSPSRVVDGSAASLLCIHTMPSGRVKYCTSHMNEEAHEKPLCHAVENRRFKDRRKGVAQTNANFGRGG